MKMIFLFAVLAWLLFAVDACHKSSAVTGSLAGSWEVVNDSSLNTNKFYTLATGDSGIVSSNYKGAQCGATFNFKSNGFLLTSFFDCIYGYGPTFDSASYIVKGDQVTVSILSQ